MLASRGSRETTRGIEAVSDPAERGRLGAQGRRVLWRAHFTTAIATALSLLI